MMSAHSTWRPCGVCAAIDAVTFLVAAATIARMRLHEAPPTRSGPHWLSELTAGLAHIRAEAALRRMTIATAIGFLVIGINESALFAVVGEGLHRPPEFVGVLASTQGVGAIGGGLLAARLIGSVGELAAITIASGLVAIAALSTGSWAWGEAWAPAGASTFRVTPSLSAVCVAPQFREP